MTMTVSQAYQAEFQGEQAIYLRHGDYEAILLPQIGGNLIAFRDVSRGYHFLREPKAEEMPAFKKIPYAHGIPVCFPPNRYEDGRLKWNNQVYQFPVNEPKTNNHLHGFLYREPWEVVHFASNPHESYVTIQFQATPDKEIYRFFPHLFTMTLTYRLSASGLLQHVQITNHGATSMPCLLAFHTALNAPFAPHSTKEDMRVFFTLGERWELNDRMLPTGKFQQKTAEEEKLNQPSGVSPYFAPMDNHYRTRPQNGSNRMELIDHKLQMKLIYDVGTAYQQWMIWNNQCQDTFFCPEPQINLVNAPNLDVDSTISGLVALHPGEVWEETSRLYIVSLPNHA